MRKAALLITLTILMAVLTVKSQTATPPTIGDGTIGNPYQIATLDNLYWISQTTAEWDKHFIQTADIDATTTDTWDSGAGFSPIGNSSINFTGSYNGQSHIIDGLFINRPTEYTLGLFGYISAASIDSLGLSNVDITANGEVGGLVGESIGASVISNSYTTGSVSGGDEVGGLVGDNSAAINNSYSIVAISSTGGSYIGGLLGYNSAPVNNSYSKGTVSGGDYVGGLVGDNNSSINNSYSTASVTGSDGGYGGLVGNNYGPISNSYSTGSVSGSYDIGGLVGIVSGGTAVNSFWDTETSGQASSAGGIGKTTAEMQTMCIYIDDTEASWDFIGENINGSDNIWGMNGSENGGYPFLVWQGYTQTESCCGYIDSENPTIICAANATVTLSEGQFYYQVQGTEFDPTTTSDNCGVDFYANDISGLSTLDQQEFEEGTHTITWYIQDIAENYTDCQFVLTVNAFVGIETLQQNGISIYPNPTNGIFTIESQKLNMKSITISDISGKLIIENMTIHQNETFDLSNFENGIYIIKIQTDHTSEILRFVKR